MLTPNIDVAAAHTFDAFPVMSSTGDTRWDTLNSGDKLTGDGAGSVLNIITVDEAQGAGGSSETTDILPTISNVETLNANVHHTLTINSQYVTGMKNVNVQQVGGNSATSFKMLGVDSKLENISVSNLENNKGRITTQFKVNSKYLEAADDVLNLAVDNVVVGIEGVSEIDVAPTNTANVYETLNLASNGSYNNAFGLVSTAGTINVSGAANVEIGAAKTNGTLKTLDASTATGNVAVYGLDKVVESAKFAAGDDIVSFTSLGDKFTATVDGGAGEDLLAIDNHGFKKETTGELNSATNFETIRLSNEGSTLDLDKLTNGVKKFEVAGDNDFAFENANKDHSFTVINSSWLGITHADGTGLAQGEVGGDVTYAGTTNKLTITNKAPGSETAVTLTNRIDEGTLSNFLTNANDISVVSTGNKANTIEKISAGYRVDSEGKETGAEKFISIKVTGDQDLTVNKLLTSADSVYAVIQKATGDYLNNGYKVDASALQGKLVLNGADAESDIVIGTAKADEIATGTQVHGVKAKPAFVTFEPTHNAADDTTGKTSDPTANAQIGETATVTLDEVLTAFYASDKAPKKDLSVTVTTVDGSGDATYTVKLDAIKDYLKTNVADLFTFTKETTATGGATIVGDSTTGWSVTTTVQEAATVTVKAKLEANALSGKVLADLLDYAVDADGNKLSAAYDITAVDSQVTLTQTDGNETVLTQIVINGIHDDGAADDFFTGGNDSNTVLEKNKDLNGVEGVVGTYDKFTGGEGADKFTFEAFYVNGKEASTEQSPTAEITDFESGVDTIKFLQDGAQKGDADNFKVGKLYGSLEELYKAAGKEFKDTAITQYFVGQVGNDTYLFNDGNVNDGTWFDAVKLTGVDLTGIAASDIVA